MVSKKKGPASKSKKTTSKRPPAKKAGSPSAKSRRKKTATSCKKRAVLKWSVMLFLWGLLAGGLSLIWFGYDLPKINYLAESTRRPSITFLARDKTKIATIGEYYGDPVDARKLPKKVVQAFVAIEDRRFFDHFGIDVFGIARALYQNLSKGGVVQGGSTITQQLAKNFLLTKGLYDYRDRSLRRKIQEVLMALWLEQKFTKEQILTIYLNRVYFGSGAFGIGAASHQYFSKKVKDLNLFEAALLAGLLKAPSKYSPLNDEHKAVDRAKNVLTAMKEAGFITDKEVKRWNGDICLPCSHKNNSRLGRYFIDWVLEKIPDLIGGIYQDLVVRTTLQPTLQRQAEKAVNDVLDKYGEDLHAHQGALVTLAPSGAVLAMVGGRSYFKSQFNRATQAVRQPGSIFKLFVYLAALEQGIDPRRQVLDTPVKIGGWSPKNYGWKTRGSISMKEGFSYSINTVTARLARLVGRGRVVEMARRLGVTTRQPKDLTLCLGSGDATLLQMTTAYAVIARDGYPVAPFGIISIRSRRGRLLYHSPPRTYSRIISASVSQKMDSMLRSVMNYGTGRTVRLNGTVCAGKTGTTQNYRDAWFVGYNNAYITGVWVGNDDNDTMRKVTGASLPGKIWHRFMSQTK